MSDIRSCIDDVWSDFNEAINVTDTDADRARVVASITQLAQRLQFASDADKQHAAVVACETLLAASAARIEYPDPESLVWLNQVISQLVPLVPQDHYNKRIRLCRIDYTEVLRLIQAMNINVHDDAQRAQYTQVLYLALTHLRDNPHDAMTPVDEDEREIARAHYDYYCNDRRDLNDPSFGPNAGIGAAGMVLTQTISDLRRNRIPNMSVNVLLASILRTASLKCFGHQTAPTFQQSKTALELAVMTTVKLINEAIRYVYGMGCLGDINERKYLFYAIHIVQAIIAQGQD